MVSIDSIGAWHLCSAVISCFVVSNLISCFPGQRRFRILAKQTLSRGILVPTLLMLSLALAENGVCVPCSQAGYSEWSTLMPAAARCFYTDTIYASDLEGRYHKMHRLPSEHT